MAELPKTYTPAEAESRWYQYWYAHRLYDAQVPADTTQTESFTIVIPPPNVTGMLTMGHILNNTLQDLYIRWHRMQGKVACWIPGMDHAGIATQSKVVRALADDGVNFRDLGREGFVEKVWEWKEKYGGIILQQLRALGVSVDWRRERFTMEPALSSAVTEVFVRLFDKGLIYRGKRIVNWSPLAQTTLSDEEVIHKEVQDTMYTLRYHRPDGSGTVRVATARPETLFGDVAVAVNPKDERYAGMIGTTLIVPLVGREVPIIADDYADPTFGTGAVKITPAHDPNDYEVGTRHNLPMPNTINPDGVMNELAGPLSGLDRFAARKLAVKLLQEADLIESMEPYTHSVGFSERGGEQIEPYLSDQWFVKMAPLAKPALQAVKEGHIAIAPEHWTKTYEHWMTNIRDWAISRQLWWGHRIPVYYAPDGRYTAARTPEEARTKLGLDNDAPLRQDEDVLDTWFSSWLWPFSVHGWGSDEKNERELAYFYPTDLLVTGPDIIFFWVARMIMAGIEFMPGEPKSDGTPRTAMQEIIPFRQVYFTSIIRDRLGRKMSKSLGNSPDPLDVIATYGADALRFTIVYLAPSGQDVRFDEEFCEIGRNFANKVWNAGRFLMMKRDDVAALHAGGYVPFPSRAADLAPVTDSDRWILSRFHSALAEVKRALEGYRINEYSKLIYDFVWRDFCDWYLELLKTELAISTDSQRSQQMVTFAFGLYDQLLRMLHPIMPFVTEEIWQNISTRAEGDSISIAPFPAADAAMIAAGLEHDFQTMQECVEAIRRMRSEANVPPSKGVDVTLHASDQKASAFFAEAAGLIQRLARIENLTIGLDTEKPKLSATEVVRGTELHVHLEGLIDVEKERQKTEKEIARLEGQIKGTEAKLSNEKFVANAPEEVVAKEREKLEGYRQAVSKLKESLALYA
ncbi:MAG: valine--tRNA ligase [Chlorobi bacterium]|nr:MAG: valyl-tRNA synthetase [Chlorobi bacterium OLB7]MBK8909830.1 valine--tRNA ligase [Chlorobiota bacterium]MBX7215584.1 valine--tRNA ligase [Candidatus Kapabacteria bacterium]